MISAEHHGYATFFEFVRQKCSSVDFQRFECPEQDVYTILDLASQLGAAAEDNGESLTLEFGEDALTVEIYPSLSPDARELEFADLDIIGITEDDGDSDGEDDGLEMDERVVITQNETVAVEKKETSGETEEEGKKKRSVLFWGGILLAGTLAVGGAVAGFVWWKRRKKGKEASA